MLTVAIPKRNKLQNIIVLTPKDGTGLSFLFTIRDIPELLGLPGLPEQ